VSAFNQFNQHKPLIRNDEIDRYLMNGCDFIDDDHITGLLKKHIRPENRRIRDILSKSLSLQRLDPEETAALLNVQDDTLWEEIFAAALAVKDRVYGPRIVTFAPLYISNLCDNSCLYCGFNKENTFLKRRMLTKEEVQGEIKVLVSMGHKRLIVVYGEHPETGIYYMKDTIETIYGTKVGNGEIRRVNVNAPPQSISHLKILRDVGIGTFQVFQETYHHGAYKKFHPRGLKSNYRWRLYAHHRAQEAGLDDVGIGALFGLYDWRFEVMGLLYHAIDLENKFDGVGPHTISFPRLEPAAHSPLNYKRNTYAVSDRNFKRLVAVIRLSVPYTGMIITAREPAHVRMDAITIGCTQTDASTRIGVGAYSDRYNQQEFEQQQFLLRDTRSLDEVIRELADMGYITSFCTAGYRCGRTGSNFMNIAKKGKVKEFCIPNAVITFKEYLLDYASDETRAVGDKMIESFIKKAPDNVQPLLKNRLKETENGARDIRF
jgi:2-iminoacetate synthase